VESVAGYMPAAVLQSSRDRRWHGLEIMVARLANESLDVGHLPTHTIAINVGRPFRLKGSVEGRRVDAPMTSGATKIVAAGPRSSWHWDRGGPIDMLHVSVSAAELRAHVDELEIGPEPEIVTRVGFEDLHLRRIGQAFAAELHATVGASLMSDALRTELLLRILAEHSSLAGTGTIQLPAQRLAMTTLRRLDDYVGTYLADDIGIADLAVLAGVSRFHFARMFKATTGMTPYRYVLERRIERADALLRQSSLSIGEVAAATGFADQSHLARHVKQRYGITPRAFRPS
jgi:AraC family transcriptional regulator